MSNITHRWMEFNLKKNFRKSWDQLLERTSIASGHKLH